MEGLSELAAIFVASLAALLSLFSSRESRKSSKEAANAARTISKMQYELQVKDLELQYHSEIRLWAASVIDSMGKLIALCYLAPSRCQFN